MIYPISENTVQNAIDGAARSIREYRQISAFYKTLSQSALCGRVINKAIVPQLETLFPGWAVRYSISEYGKHPRNLYLSRVRSDESTERYTLQLATQEEPRLSRVGMVEQFGYYLKQAQDLENSLSDFSNIVAQYNNLVPFLSQLENKLRPVMYHSGARNW